MTVNVKGRTITIDDTLAKRYEKMFLEPINEETLLAYFVLTDPYISSNIQNYTDQELNRMAALYMEDDVSFGEE
jgi:hypothetical protein